MKKFKGSFIHNVELTYEFEVEAKTKEEALEKVNEDPFFYVDSSEPIDEQGLNIYEVEINEEIKEEEV